MTALLLSMLRTGILFLNCCSFFHDLLPQKRWCFLNPSVLMSPAHSIAANTMRVL